MDDSFYSTVDEFFVENSKSPLYSSSDEHSCYLINKIFQKAKKNVVIYAGNDFWLYKNEGIKHAVKSKKLKLSIITDEEKDAENFAWIFPNAKIKKLNSPKEFNLEIFILDSEYTTVQHFMTADNKYVRVEKPHLPDAENVHSLAYANYRDLARVLTILTKRLIEND